MGLTAAPPRKREQHDVRTLSLTYYDGYSVAPHRHEWAQLIWARCGMMRVTVDGSVWLVPSTRAIWIPAHTLHEFCARGQVAFRTVYIADRRSRAVERRIGALEVSPLLAELIMHILAEGMLDPEVPPHDRLAGVLVDLINAAQSVDLILPLPTDARALRLADHFQSRPEDNSVLPILANKVGASVRTLQRRFVAETGMTIESWRQKVRLISAAACLANGSSVTDAALTCGYDSPSAFIAAFKRQFSMTPKKFGMTRLPHSRS